MNMKTGKRIGISAVMYPASACGRGWDWRMSGIFIEFGLIFASVSEMSPAEPAVVLDSGFCMLTIIISMWVI